MRSAASPSGVRGLRALGSAVLQLQAPPRSPFHLSGEERATDMFGGLATGLCSAVGKREGRLSPWQCLQLITVLHAGPRDVSHGDESGWRAPRPRQGPGDDGIPTFQCGEETQQGLCGTRGASVVSLIAARELPVALLPGRGPCTGALCLCASRVGAPLGRQRRLCGRDWQGDSGGYRLCR